MVLRAKIDLISDSPSESDPATENAHSRQSICEDILGSRYFSTMYKYFDAISTDRVFDLLKDDTSRSQIFDHLFDEILVYSQNGSTKQYKYSNLYLRLEFIHRETMLRNKEHVFICPMENQMDASLELFYVSKEYHVSVSKPYLVGRFVFQKWSSHAADLTSMTFNFVILAEGPALVYGGPNFNVELHYLTMRKNRQQGKF